MKNLQDKNIVVLAHVLTTVPAEDLKKYFINYKIKRLLFIALPLFFEKGRPGPYYELYENGALIKKVLLPNRKLPSVFQYARDYLLGCYWTVINGPRWDLMIALDNLNTFTGISVRLIGRVKKIIYYTIDFVPKRFRNPFLDAVYHQIDKIAIEHADVTWNLTQRMIDARQQVLGIQKKHMRNQFVVPIGAWLADVPRRSSRTSSHTLIYAGGLLPHQGVQLVLDALPDVVKQIPDVKFFIIGMGKYKKALEEKSAALHLQRHVSFLGYMETHEEVEEELASADLAVAMYSKELDVWSYYADPSKIKTYLAAGLPVITTDVTYIARSLEKAKCGIVVPYDSKKLAYAIIEMFSHKTKLNEFSKNALTFSQQFDWEKIFAKGLSYV